MNEYYEKIKLRYRNGESFANQNAEDMVGRRILKALNISDKKLPYIEKELFGERYEEPLWCRTRRLLYEVIDENSLIRRKTVDVLEDFNTLKKTVERIEELGADSPIYFVRIKDTSVIEVVFSIHKQLIVENLKPPFTVIKELGVNWICRQKVLEFLNFHL